MAPQAPRILGPEQTRQVAVVCESTCCLPAELIRRYNIGIIPIPFVFGSETFLDGVDSGDSNDRLPDLVTGLPASCSLNAA